jgi:hypothetical protein
MNLKERFTVFCLTAFDRLMDANTSGLWTKVCGDVRDRSMRVKR